MQLQQPSSAPCGCRMCGAGGAAPGSGSSFPGGDARKWARGSVDLLASSSALGAVLQVRQAYLLGLGPLPQKHQVTERRQVAVCSEINLQCCY